MTVLEMRKLLGLTQKAFSEKYNIPKRSIESWEGGQRQMPEWARALLERAVLEDAKEMNEMKKDLTTKIYDDVFRIKEDHLGVNSLVKAVIINFGDDRGDIIVENDNYGTDEPFADFTEGKKKAGLHPMQIVFSGLDTAKIMHDRYIGPDDKIHTF